MSLIKNFDATIELTQGPLLQIFPVPTILERTDVVQDYKVISLVAEEAWQVSLTVKNNDVLVDLSSPALSVSKMRISVWDEETVTPVELTTAAAAGSDLANGLIVFKCPKDAIDPLWANDFDRIPAGRIVIDFQLENSDGPTYFYDRINIIDSAYGGTGNVAPNSKNYLEAADVKSRALAAAGYTLPTGDSDLAQKKYVDDQLATIDLAAHEADLANPHVVTAAQVGNSTAQWNADKIEGIATDLSGIANGEIVGYDGVNFVPVAASGLPAGTTGDILINNAGTYEVLLPGASGTVLKSNGALALPSYETVSGTGDVVGPASAVSGNIPSYDGVTGKLMDDSGVVAAEVVQRGDVIATAVDEVQLGVKGASGQTANIFEVQDSGSVVLAGFDKDGTVFSEIVETNDHQLLAEVAAPATPAANKVSMYAKADGLVYSKDDAGVETLMSSGSGGGGGSGIANTYTFDTTTTASDPGADGMRFNNATPASVTEIYINDDANGVDISSLIDFLSPNDTLYIQETATAANYILAKITSITDNTGWYTIVVTIDDSGVLPTNTGTVGVSFGRGSLSLDNSVTDATTARTLGLSDVGKSIRMTSASANVITIPLNSTTPLPVNSMFVPIQDGAGQTTITAAASVTLNGSVASSFILGTQYAGSILTQISANTWTISSGVDKDYVFLGTSGAISAAASVEFTTAGWFEGTYSRLDFEFINITPASDAVIFQLTASTDGGSTYLAGTNYQYATDGRNSSASNVNSASTGAANIPLHVGNIGNLSTEINNGVISLFQPDAALYTQLTWLGAFTSASPNIQTLNGAAMIATTSAIDAIKFDMSSGNIASGEIRVYGVR